LNVSASDSLPGETMIMFLNPRIHPEEGLKSSPSGKSVCAVETKT